jgi:hypothetical protein
MTMGTRTPARRRRGRGGQTGRGGRQRRNGERRRGERAGVITKGQLPRRRDKPGRDVAPEPATGGGGRVERFPTRDASRTFARDEVILLLVRVELDGDRDEPIDEARLLLRHGDAGRVAEGTVETQGAARATASARRESVQHRRRHERVAPVLILIIFPDRRAPARFGSCHISIDSVVCASPPSKVDCGRPETADFRSSSIYG